jgi:Zn-finger nucleic acid-binding protein
MLGAGILNCSIKKNGKNMATIKVTCDKPLCPGELSVTHKNGVEIDYCAHCKGVWLDKGELDKVIEAENQEINQVEEYHRAAQHTYAERNHYPKHSYDPYYKHHKKKPIWKDLFDFD